MHELSLCEDIIEQLSVLAKRHGAASIARVRVRIGALSGVEPMLLESAFRSARIETIAAQAEIDTEWVQARVKCRNCGGEADAPPNDLGCPTCGSLETELTRGDELMLASVELLVPEPAEARAAEGRPTTPRGH